MTTGQESDPNQKSAAGFTLVELMVVVGIIAVITSIVVFNHREFSDRLEVTNAAYEIALLLREAQIAGTAVRAAGDVGAGEGFNYAYGVYASLAGFSGPGPKIDTNISSDNKLVFFVDRISGDTVIPYTPNTPPNTPPNMEDYFDCRNNTECLSVLELKRGVRMEQICVGYTTGGPPEQSIKCRDVNESNKIGIAVTFLRPSPDAKIYSYYLDGGVLTQFMHITREFVRICLTSPTNKRKKVEVEATGGISVGDLGNTSGNCQQG